MASLRFYLDENLPVQIALQLQTRGIDVITVRDLHLLGVRDEEHFRNAAKLGRVICTHDSDFIDLAAQGIPHASIVFGQQNTHYIGEWVNWLTLMHAVYTAEEMQNRVEYL